MSDASKPQDDSAGKHTPGPLMALSFPTWHHTDVVPENDPTASSNATFVVARCYGPDQEANAELFAAAPDMLAVLDALCQPNEKRVMMPPALWRMVKAARAKGRGHE